MNEKDIITGILHLPDDRKDGQLRDSVNPLKSVPGQLIIARQFITDNRLKSGQLISGTLKGRHLSRLTAIEGVDPADFKPICMYEADAIDPQPQLKLEHSPTEHTTRIMDILAPIGFGQRGLIVSPPRSGKTILLQNIAKGIKANYPDSNLILLLIDERPEEVTDMRRNVPGTVYASSNDNTIERHLELAQLVIERCKRRLEMGENVIVLLDSLTRMGRAFNSGGPQGGRTMSGGLDNRALEIPKRLFGAARKIENGGSLTIIATCLVDTGSRMDQVIFEEFKGTGNMELTLDRDLANLRLYPAFNILQSGTRKEEKLLDPISLAAATRLRRHLITLPPKDAIKTLLDAMVKFKTNDELYKALSV
jgi:transcription termination factor Rho